MPYSARSRKRTNRKANQRKNPSLQKPSGVISPRIQKVGGEEFAIVCVDPAKHRSEWMMADYFGNILIQPQTLEHQGPFFKLAIELIRQTQQKLRKFHHVRQTPLDRMLADLETAVEQLPYDTCGREAFIVAKVLQEQTPRRRGGAAIGELLPAVLVRLNIRTEDVNRDRS